MDSTAVSVWQWVQTAGLTASLFFILYGGWKRMWVWGWQLEEMRQERDQWRAFAMRGTAIADKAVKHLERGGRFMPQEPIDELDGTA
jgi:hypothetical protein